MHSKDEVGYFDPLDTPGFRVGVSFGILIFGGSCVLYNSSFGNVLIQVQGQEGGGMEMDRYVTLYGIKLRDAAFEDINFIL